MVFVYERSFSWALADALFICYVEERKRATGAQTAALAALVSDVWVADVLLYAGVADSGCLIAVEDKGEIASRVVILLFLLVVVVQQHEYERQHLWSGKCGGKRRKVANEAGILREKEKFFVWPSSPESCRIERSGARGSPVTF